MNCPKCDGILYRYGTVYVRLWKCEKCPAVWTREELEKEGAKSSLQLNKKVALYKPQDQEDDGEG